MTESSPERLIVELLAAAVDAEAAAASLYPLLAPRMLASIGTQADLRRTLGNPLFAPLVGGGVKVVEVEALPGVARVRVAVDDGAGGRAPYLFSLAREGSDRSGDWQVTGLLREDVA